MILPASTGPDGSSYGAAVASSDSALLQRFVDDCRAAAKSDDAVIRIVALVEQLVADPALLASEVSPLPASIPAAGVDESLFVDDDLTVLVVGTPSGVDQPPHDHRMAAVIGVFDGIEDQRFFVKVPSGLRELTGRSIATGEVMSLGRKTIHAISTPGPQPCRAIHVYVGNLESTERSIFHPETFVEEPLTLDRYADYCRPTTEPTTDA